METLKPPDHLINFVPMPSSPTERLTPEQRAALFLNFAARGLAVPFYMECDDD